MPKSRTIDETPDNHHVLGVLPLALLHVARFNYPFVKLYPMLDAFCSSEVFRETLDGARRVYLN